MLNNIMILFFIQNFCVYSELVELGVFEGTLIVFIARWNPISHGTKIVTERKGTLNHIK